jgi:uncharacterized membrane protein YebE (DUF533 family)
MAKGTPQPDKRELSESLIYMWRCVIALAHADGTVQDEEKTYLDNIVANLDRVYGLTPAQKKVFADDMKTPRKISDLLPHVKNPEDRASLIYFGDLLVWKDGELSASEEEILKKLHDDQMSKVDVAKLEAEIKADLKKRQATRVQELKQLHASEQKKHPVFAALDRLMLRMGIDIFD